MNNAAVDKGVDAIVKIDVPADWANCADEELYPKTGNKFVDEVMVPMNKQEGHDLPISKLMDQQMVRSPPALLLMKNAA